MPPKTAASLGQPQDETKKSFLDLPPETRNEIYNYWATSITTFLVRPKGKAYTTASHPATQISRTVHREFTGLLAQLAPTNAKLIKVRILDLDFYPLTTYLNRVIDNPDADWRQIGHPAPASLQYPGGLPGLPALPPNVCDLDVELSFTANFPAEPQVEKAARFARYLQTKVPGLAYNTRIVAVAGDAKQTSSVLRGLGGLQPSPMWRGIMLAFGRWERERSLKEQRRLEREAREYYEAIYATVPVPEGEWAGFQQTEEDEAAATAERSSDFVPIDGSGVKVEANEK